MLVLSRHKDESIMIKLGNDVVKVKIVDIRSDKVRLGFEAPKHIEIYREEIYEKIQKEKADEAESGLGEVIGVVVEGAGEVLGAVLEGLE